MKYDRTLLKTGLLLLVILLFMGCRRDNKEINFELSSSNQPIVTFKTGNNKEYHLMFDTGWTPPCLYEKGMEKVYSTHKRFKFIDNYLIKLVIEKKYPEMYRKEMDHREFFYGKNHYLPVNFRYFKTGKSIFTKKKFYYTPLQLSGYSQNSKDGVFGIDFLGEVRNITIDYNNGKIILNDDRLDTTYCDMYEMQVPYHYAISINIDGKEELAEIDTGCNAFIISQRFVDQNINIYSGEHNGKAREKDYLFNKIEICGISFENITGYLSTDPRNHTSEASIERTQEISLLGYSFFRDRVIQLDFENGEFCIK
ncbi:MAG: hypothetical protein PQJ59_13900 [Spirochaetales bacterium]|nr:hypothetical protein [Spirochaetales bacterium]